MTVQARTEQATRDRILRMLSDEEVAAVASVGSTARLAEGDEYLDLERLDLGVQWAVPAAAPAGHLLARRAIREPTWHLILARVRALTAGTRPLGP